MCAVVLPWMLASGAHAEEAAPGSSNKPPLWLQADECPSAPLVREMLEPLVGHQRSLQLEGDGATKGDAALRASVRDQGDFYVILVAGVTRSQEDVARDCRERARVAAVFIALNLRAPLPPPAPGPAPAAVAAPPATPLPAPPTAAPEDPTVVQLRLGAFASFAYAPTDQLAGGGGLALWLRYGLFGIGLESGAMSATQLAIDPGAGHVSLLRLPSALLGAAMWRISRVSLGPTLGLAADVLRAQGRAVDQSAVSWRANFGAQIGLRTETHLSESWSLSAAISGSYYPRSYELRVEPDGRLAHTPHIWLAAQLGLLCRLR